MSDIDSFLETLGFEKTKYDVCHPASISDLIPKRQCCGIYVLHFANDEYYVGLTVNVRTRYLQHCQTYDDIVFLSFKTVPLKQLRKEEEKIIKKAEKADFKLRNKVHTSVTVSSSPFDEIMNSETQARWLQDLSFNDYSGERLVDDELYRKCLRNFQKLQKLPSGNEAIDVFRQYMMQCIPSPFQTELYYWSASCLPGNGKWLYIRLNIKQEVLRITQAGDDIDCTFFVARSVYETDNKFKNLWHSGRKLIQYRAISGGVGMYEAGGQDQIEVSVSGYENIVKILQDVKFIQAVRTLNLRIMRKTFNLQYKSHCYALADTALESL